MTTQTDKTNDVAADVLRGAAAIAAFIGATERQAQHLLENRRLPAFKEGGIWKMRKSTYLAHLARLEAKALADMRV